MTIALINGEPVIVLGAGGGGGGGGGGSSITTTSGNTTAQVDDTNGFTFTTVDGEVLSVTEESFAVNAGGNEMTLDGSGLQVNGNPVGGGNVIYDTLNNMPGAGTQGRLFYPSDLQGSYFYDDGSQWNKISPGNAALYPPFVPSGIDDEFDDNHFTGWTVVDDSTQRPTITELNDTISIIVPGGDSGGHLHAYLKSWTPSASNQIEMAFNGQGVSANYHMCGLIMADGNTYNSGTQVVWAAVPSQNNMQMFSQTGFNAQGSNGTYALETIPGSGLLFLRLQYVGFNEFIGYVSADGTSWVNVTGDFNVSCSPTYVGFFVTSWGASGQHCWNLRYFKHIGGGVIA